MEILVNNEIKELNITDPKTNTDWTQDLLGNNDAYDGYDDELETHTMEPETYEWWANYIDKQQTIDDRIYELRQTLEDEELDKLESEIGEIGSCDLEDEQTALAELLENYN